MNKLRIGVLMGGMSIEREVSFNSGRTICDHLDSMQYTIIPLFQTDTGTIYKMPWHFMHRGKIADFQDRLSSEGQLITWDGLKEVVDFIYIAMHGRYAEDGALQGMLELLKIPYLGSGILTSALCRDKVLLKNFLDAAHIATPTNIIIYPEKYYEYQSNPTLLHQDLTNTDITFPCIIKPHREGSSIGVSIVHSYDTLLSALHHAATITPDIIQTVIIENYITGMEFSCIVLADKNGTFFALPPTEIELEADTHIFDYHQKYMPGRAIKHTPARCCQTTLERIKQECLRIAILLDIKTIGRIDGFLQKDGTITIIDVNTISGMSPSGFIFLAAAEIGMSHTALINHLITVDLHRHHIMVANTSDNNTYEHAIERKKMKVAVLLGGSSNEREISLESGRNVVYKLSPHKYEVLPIFVDSNDHLYLINQSLLVRNSTTEIALLITHEMRIQWHQLPQLSDFVFNALHGGSGENGIIQGALETLKIPYNGSSIFASSLCMNKFKTTQYLKTQGLQVPTELLIPIHDWYNNQQPTITHIKKHITYPCIVKPHDDGCSVLVHKVSSDTQLCNAIEAIFTNNKKMALIQEFITGMELTVGVIGNHQKVQALPPSQAVVNGDILSIEEKFLPGAGENQTPAPLPDTQLVLIQKTIEKAYKAVQCAGYARIDCFYQTADESPTGNERVVILEINTLPALTPATCLFHQAAEIGIRPMDFIDTIITLGYAYHCPTKQVPTIKNPLIQHQTRE